ncbi:methionine aminopeptidase [Metabacillus sediminilitoris]|uniref:Methionine aminopeptidase n=1 Tax=Metabacillus sediminilitoris TaxID=2567941 RepID=A0A4S4BRN0_9BACI|nr:methionine aminopeptidase [Metabacillus sediminilitoris]QGQ47724.1 methionine aminopeptidase [Metabacillus sediminilitoris]THF76829.1 methionine aminopeptidase [Metabacillus sediminilitoris]
MKFFRFFTNWYKAKQEKHMNKMKIQGKCPVCRGNGFASISSPYLGNIVECYYCKGTGLYAEWEKNK